MIVIVTISANGQGMAILRGHLSWVQWTIPIFNLSKRVIKVMHTHMEFESNQVAKNLECPQWKWAEDGHFWWPFKLAFIRNIPYWKLDSSLMKVIHI